jgi:hypothetical protein
VQALTRVALAGEHGLNFPPSGVEMDGEFLEYKQWSLRGWHVPIGRSVFQH